MARNSRQDPVHGKHLEADCVVESVRRVPIRQRVDVLVCGGGPAGVGAAIAAAREGARTLLIERHGMLGGVWTAGLLNPFFECLGRGWCVDDLTGRLERRGALMPWLFTRTFDTEMMRLVLEEMLTEAGAQWLYHTWIADAIVSDGTVRGAVIESKAGRQAVLADVVIDATGDGDIAARAGCQYELGRIEDGLLQPMTLMFEVRGVEGFSMDDSRPLYDAMARAIREHRIDFTLPFPRAKYVPWIIATPRRGTADVQLTHVYRMNSLEPADVTAATVQARAMAHKAAEVLRHVPGLENLELTHTAAHIGVREGRRIRGHYRLEMADLAGGREFEDGIATCTFVVDVHDPELKPDRKDAPPPRTRPFEIPYRCLVAADVDRLLLAGRLISGSHEAHGAYRQTGTAMATGQAAGLAAAWAVRNRCSPAAIDGRKLKSVLKERGAVFLSQGNVTISVPEHGEA